MKKMFGKVEEKRKTMKLPLPLDVEFYEDICPPNHRPHGVLDRAAINKMISVIGELEFTLKKPFNRFLDTVATDAVDSIWNTSAAFLFIADASTAIGRP
jgi:hypothetical protein